MLDWQWIVSKLELKKLPGEGGYYRETYRSKERVEGGEALAGSAIYYLVTSRDYSKLHRLKYPEIYHFYLGDPVELFSLSPEGESKMIELGPRIDLGQSVQSVVDGGLWQGLKILQPTLGWALLGTTMGPGYELKDFELANVAELAERFPSQRAKILSYG